MAAFFDTRAALAKIRNQRATPATSATPATQGGNSGSHVANVADVAAPTGQIPKNSSRVETAHIAPATTTNTAQTFRDNQDRGDSAGFVSGYKVQPRQADGIEGGVSDFGTPRSNTTHTGNSGTTCPETTPDTRPKTAEPPHGNSVGLRPKTWAGKVVSLDAWRQLTDWEKHGPNGRVWNGKTQQWERGNG